MPQPRTRSHHGFEQDLNRELRRAELQRRRLMAAGILAAVVGLVLVSAVGVYAFGAKRATAKAAAASTALGGGAAPESASPVPTRPAESKDPTPVEATDVATGADAASDPAPPAETPAKKPAAPKPAVQAAPKVQSVAIKIGESGYVPFAPEVKAGIPVTITVGKGEGCAAGFLMPSLGVSADNSEGPAKVKLPALKAGVYKFTCGMEMVEGRLVVL